MGHLNWIIFVQNVPKKPKFPPDEKKIIMDQLCTVETLLESFTLILARKFDYEKLSITEFNGDILSNIKYC